MATTEKSISNLKSFDKISPEEARKIQSAGGKAGVISRNKTKKMKEAMRILMKTKIPIKNVEKELKAMGLEDEDLNIQMAIAYGQAKKAMESMDTQASVFCRDTAGDKPVDRQEVDNNVKITMDKDIEELSK